MTPALVFDATARTFQSEVMERSLTVPVLIDFWASWCGPCRTLGPILEKLAAEYDGSFLLAKVDSDKELELAQAFQVQSIPFVILIADGRPVDGFTGAQGEDRVREFLARHGIEPAGGAAEPQQVDPDAPAERLRRAREAVRSGDVAGAEAALAGFPEEAEEERDRQNILVGLAFLSAEFPEAPAAAARLGDARRHFLAGEWEAALAAIVDSAAEDRGYGEDMARRAMMLVQGTLGPMEVVDLYRRRLATLLY